MLSNKESYGNECLYKYFIGYIYIYIYKGNALPSPLCIKFQEMKAYAKYFHRNNKCMNHESFS